MFKKFEFNRLNSELTFEDTFSNRKVAYFGEFPYKYTGGYHRAKQIPSDSYLAEILVAVQDFCKDHNLNYSDFNSCMVTKYDTHDTCIPPHSDNESSIVEGSNILTVSIGGTRNIVFRRRPPGAYHEEKLTVKHGQCYLMSRKSQDAWDHAVPKIDAADFDGPRISITFRKLAPSNNQQRSANSPRAPQQAKRVLVLSNSKNSSFDCLKFKSPVVAFRENLFLLRDLEQHSEAVKCSDAVSP